MGIADRKAKEKEELRTLILNGAKKLFADKGIEQTNMRNIADAINYSVGTIYVYFKDKNAIFHALHTQGFIELGSQFKTLYNVSNPIERLRAMGKVYMLFAAANPDMYDLMFNVVAPIDFLDGVHQDEWDEGKATFDVLKTTVQECIHQGHFKGHTAESLAFMIWSTVHGMCSLEIRQRTKGVKFSNPDTILDEGYAALLMILDKH